MRHIYQSKTIIQNKMWNGSSFVGGTKYSYITITDEEINECIGEMKHRNKPTELTEIADIKKYVKENQHLNNRQLSDGIKKIAIRTCCF